MAGLFARHNNASIQQENERIVPLKNGISIRVANPNFPRRVSVALSIELEDNFVYTRQETDALVRCLVNKYEVYSADDIRQLLC